MTRPKNPDAGRRSRDRPPSEPARGGRRPLRADAARNRDRLVAAAHEVFRERGLDAGVAEIARRAGVGSATLFRNFASKDDLVSLVLRRHLEDIRALAERALAIDDPAAAFEFLVFGIGDLHADDRAFLEAIRSGMLDDPRNAAPRDQMIATANKVLERAQRAGVVRADVGPDDLRFLLVAVTRDDPFVGAPGNHRRFLRIILDGLRPANASPLDPPPATSPGA